jgi:uncharacterized membrane protein YbhN (UPF0104 family)
VGTGSACYPEPVSTPSARRSNLAKAAVSLSAVGLLLWRVDTASLSQALGRIHSSTAIFALFIYFSGQMISALRWSLALRAAGFMRPRGWILRVYFGAMFFNLFAPATFGGDTVRTVALGREDARHAEAVATVAFDRVSGLATLCLLATTAMVLGAGRGWPPAIGWVAGLLGLVLILGPGWLALPLFGRLPFAKRLWGRLGGPGHEFWRSPGLWLRSCALSLVLHLHQIAAAWLIGQAIGLEVPASYYFVFHPFVIIFGALPISFGGFGVREVGYVWALSEMRAVPAEVALAFGLLWSALLLTASALGGLVVLIGGLPSRDPLGPSG